MKRSLLTLLVAGAVTPLAAQDPLFFLHSRGGQNDAVSVNFYKTESYRPVRLGENRAAAYLTELRTLPSGTVLGAVSPEQFPMLSAGGVALPGVTIGLRPPAGAAYKQGDTVQLAMVAAGPRAWGSVIIPTGLARIDTTDAYQTRATVLVVFGPVRAGQVVLPLDAVVDPGAVAPTPAEGPAGQVIGPAVSHEFTHQATHLFVDMGRAAGIRLGDFVAIHRKPEPRPGLSATIDEVMAVGQVVRVNEKSSTLKITRVIVPNIPAGSPAVRIATLPN